MEEISIVMEMERATKNKVLYKATEKEGVVIENIYISKSAFNDSEPPLSVTVKVQSQSKETSGYYPTGWGNSRLVSYPALWVGCSRSLQNVKKKGKQE